MAVVLAVVALIAICASVREDGEDQGDSYYRADLTKAVEKEVYPAKEFL
jgi:hypothetical protein